MASPTAIVAYLALFAIIGFVFLFANLVVGYLVRPKDPHEEKLEIYECGEPAIGSSFVQFDLRFYVVALVFIVFDAEVAFLFPSATVFGKLAELGNKQIEVVAVDNETGNAELTPQATNIYRELGVLDPTLAGVVGAENAKSVEAAEAVIRGQASDQPLSYQWFVLFAILDFFLVLFIAFAYEWKLGAFEWVRSLEGEQSERGPPLEPVSQSYPVLSS